MAHLAKSMDKELIRNEYVSVFIGVGRGEILPFASYYLTGFLNDKPLANLRNEMSRIGIARVETVKEPEDHVSSVFDIMAGLIRGEFGRTFTVAEQAEFYRKHIEPWVGMLMADIEAAKTVCFMRRRAQLENYLLRLKAKLSAWIARDSVTLPFYKSRMVCGAFFGGKK